jgi:hypothetical protein
MMKTPMPMENSMLLLSTFLYLNVSTIGLDPHDPDAFDMVRAYCYLHAQLGNRVGLWPVVLLLTLNDQLVNRMRRLSLLLSFVLLAAACSDSAGGNGGEQFTPGPDDDGNMEETPTPIDVANTPGASVTPDPTHYRDAVDPRFLLEFVGEDSRSMNYYNAGVFTVRYSDHTGRAQRGAEVHATFAGNAADMELGGTTWTTNAQGEATVTFETGRTSGSFTVVVSAENADDIAFTVHVRPKDSASYIVHTRYPSAALLPTQVSVRLFGADVACADLDPANLPDDLGQFDILPHDYNIPDARFVDLPNGVGYTAVSVGFLAPQVPVAFGCNDEHPLIENGFDAEVTVEMTELMPMVQGTYDIETRVDLLDALPEPWGSTLTLIGRIFAEPAALVMDLLLGDPNVLDDGFLGSIIPDNPLLRSALSNAIDQLLADLLPPEVQDVFRVGGMVYRTVSQFTLLGHLDVAAEPDSDGVLAMGNTHRYGAMVIHWDNDITLQMNELDDVGALNGEWSGGAFDAALTVDRHSLRFNYGALALALIEQIIFPALFGQGVNSVDDAIRSFIDCEQLADDVFDPIQDALLNQILLGACDETVSELSSSVTELFVGQSTPLTDLTFAASACPLEEPAEYGVDDQVRYYERVGAEDPRCIWDAQLVAGQEVRAIDSDFYGARP